MTHFLQIICQTCETCENLITLDPGPEQCDTCAAAERKELLREQQQEAKRHREIERKESIRRNQMKYETESDSSNSDRPLKYTIRKVKNEYAFENDSEMLTIGVSDVDSTEEQEESVSSTTAAATTTNTTTTTGTTTTQCSGGSTAQQADASSKMPTGPPQEWTVEGVIKFIADTDPALAVHAELFRKHVSSSFPLTFRSKLNTVEFVF